MLVVVNKPFPGVCRQGEEGGGSRLPPLTESGAGERRADGAVDDVVCETEEVGQVVGGDGDVGDAAAAVDGEADCDAGVGLVVRRRVH
jgi:hypothetical protein